MCEKEIHESKTGIPVVFSLLNAGQIKQEIFVDTTSSMYEKADSLGVSGATVKIYGPDSTYTANEVEKGRYIVETNLIPDTNYVIEVIYKDYIIRDTVFVMNIPTIIEPQENDTFYVPISKDTFKWRKVQKTYYYSIRAIYIGEDTISLFPVIVKEDTICEIFNYPTMFPRTGKYQIKVMAIQEDYMKYFMYEENDWDSVFGLFSSISYDVKNVYIQTP